MYVNLKLEAKVYKQSDEVSLENQAEAGESRLSALQDQSRKQDCHDR